jgi:replicative DNA helicase
VNTDRPLPQDIDTEKALLGAILTEPATIPAVVGLLPDDQAFMMPLHRVLYKQLVKMHAEGIPADLLTIRHTFNGRPVDEWGGVEYMIELSNSFGAASRAPDYAKIVRDLHRRRQCILAYHTAEVSAEEGDVDLVDIVERVGQGTKRALDYGEQSDGVDIMAYVDDVLSEHRTHSPTISTGIQSLDNYGVYTGSLVIVGARPSVGKSALLLQIADAVAFAEKHVLFVSQEMPPRDVAYRLISYLAGVPTMDLLRGQLSEPHRASIEVQIPHLMRVCKFLHVIGKQKTINRATSHVERTHAKYGLSLVCADYLQTFRVRRTSRDATRNDEVAEISDQINGWRHLGPAVVCAAQLNRSLEKRDTKRPVLSDLRDSGAIEQDADMVWLLSTDEKRSGPHDRVVNVDIAKNRHGPLGSLELRFDPMRYQFMG